MRRKRIIIIVLLLILGGIGMGILTWKDKKGAITDVEKMVGLNLSKNMELMNLKTYKEYGEEHAEVKLLIEREINELKESLEKICGSNLLNSGYNYPQYKNRSLWSEIQNGEIEAIYEKLTSGKKAKTINIDFFIVKNKEGENYLYIFY